MTWAESIAHTDNTGHTIFRASDNLMEWKCAECERLEDINESIGS